MMKFWKREDFKKLNQEWREKLAKEGFNDIEKENETIQPHTIKDGQEKLEYFQAIIKNLYGTERGFEIPDDMSPTELTIMALRADGCGIGEIARRINCYRTTVMFTIRRYEHLWGIKTWTMKERNLRKG